MKTKYILNLNIKKITFAVFFTFLFSLSAFAQNDSKLKPQTSAPSDFISDSCSGFPDLDYEDCCFEHDKEYYVGGSWTKRWRSDKKLYKCVAAKDGFEHKLIAPVMWLGVRAFAVPWLPTSFRWGFGQNKSRKPNHKSSKSKKPNTTGY